MAVQPVAERRFNPRIHLPAAAPAAQPSARSKPALLRRRRVVLVLGGLSAAAGLAALGTGAAAAWGAFLVVLAAGTAYLGLLHHLRRVAIEREFASLVGPQTVDLRAWNDRQPMTAPSHLTLPDPPDHTPGVGRQALELVRFAVANVAGWALSPVVFMLTLLIRETPRDTTGQRWLANLEALQDRLRDQSLRALAVSATTASVAAAGTVAAAGGAPPSFASSFTASSSVAAATVPSLAVPTAARSSYVVVPGDTLDAIAQRFGTSVAAVAAANRIADPNLIYAGQELWIPGGDGAGASAGGDRYTVVVGDTLSSIAMRFGTTVAALAAANRIADPNLIYVGKQLWIGGGGDPAPAPAPQAPSSQPDQARRAPAPSSAAAVAVATARAQVGKPYQWAGAGPESFDCSGLVMYAWSRAGIYLPHYSVAQYEDTARIDEAELEPGDLVFYNNGSGPQPGHVTIYIGGGQVITADEPGTFVRVVPLDWDGAPMGFGRVR